jgi:small subunit ribosomal protein S6
VLGRPPRGEAPAQLRGPRVGPRRRRRKRHGRAPTPQRHEDREGKSGEDDELSHRFRHSSMTRGGLPSPNRPLYSASFLLRPAPSLPGRRGTAGPLDRGKETRETVNEYEVMLLLDPELAEERQNEIVARSRELVDKSGGTWHNHEPWGRRKLAYEIDKKPEAYYHLLYFDCPAETLDELSRVLKITDGVVRHLAVRRTTPMRRHAPPAHHDPPVEAVQGVE